MNQFWDGEQCDRIGSILDVGKAVARRVRNAMTCISNQNRLVEAQVNGGNTVTYSYDAQSRRIAETVGSATTVYVYDAWNPIAEYSTTFALTKTYTWGIDLSGSMQGAGGVGGLLAVTLSSEPSAPSFFPTYDGNGNVSEYLDSTGAIAAHYKYDPFGKTTVATGPKAADFSHRFSTKPLDATTGLYYYGYRYYDPETGRWPSRDPIEESGGLNLYGFVGNDGVNRWDLLGMYDILENAIRAAAKLVAEKTSLTVKAGKEEDPIKKLEDAPFTKSIRGENYVRFVFNPRSDKYSTIFGAVYGVEYGVIVYKSCTDDEFHVGEPVRGILPSIEEVSRYKDAKGPVYGQVSAQDAYDKVVSEGHKPIIFIHSHNVDYKYYRYSTDGHTVVASDWGTGWKLSNSDKTLANQAKIGIGSTDGKSVDIYWDHTNSEVLYPK